MKKVSEEKNKKKKEKKWKMKLKFFSFQKIENIFFLKKNPRKILQKVFN